MSFPVAIIVEGVPVQLPAAAHRCPYRRATSGGGPYGQRRRRASSDLSLRKGSALEPQRLLRRRFPLISPRGVARGVKTDPRCVVRHLLPLLANIEGQPAIATAIHGIGRQARANPCGDPLTLITGGGGSGSRRRWNRLDRLNDGRLRLLDGRRLVPDHRGRWGKLALDNIVALIGIRIIAAIARRP
jgi:hypothetical protein